MCLKITQKEPKGIIKVRINDDDCILGIKTFQIKRNEKGAIRLYPRFVEKPVYSFEITKLGKIAKERNKRQNVLVSIPNEPAKNLIVSLGYHSTFIVKEEYRGCISNWKLENGDEFIIVPVIIRTFDVQLFGSEQDVTSRRFIIPKPELVKKHFSKYTFHYDYDTFYNNIITNKTN